MKRKGSLIAEEIISEIKRAEYFKEYAKRKKEQKSIYDKYKKEICSSCINKTSNSCEIRRMLDGTIKCANYKN